MRQSTKWVVQRAILSAAAAAPLFAASIAHADIMPPSGGAGKNIHPKPTAKAPDEHAAVLDYLKQRYAGKVWQSGPFRIESPEIAQIYRAENFWAVISPPPKIGDMSKPEERTAYERQINEFALHALNLRLTRAKADGKISEVPNDGRCPEGTGSATTESTMKTIAAAVIMVLDGDAEPTPAVSAKALKIKKDPGKSGEKPGSIAIFEITPSRKTEVYFDAKGSCLRLEKIDVTMPAP